MNFQSLNKLFLDRAEENSNKPFLWSKINKEWKSLTWKETSEKVKELYNNPSLRSTLGAHGEVFIKHEFSWEHTAKALINIYKNIPI